MKYLRFFYLFLITTLIISFCLNRTYPSLIRFWDDETSIIQNLTLLFYLGAILPGILAWIKRRKEHHATLTIWIALLAFLGFGEESSYGTAWFKVRYRSMRGVELDSLHDFLEVLHVFSQKHWSAFILLTSVITFLFLVVCTWLVYRYRTILCKLISEAWRNTAIRLIILCGILGVVASLIDLEFFDIRLTRWLEETLELNSAFAVLLAAMYAYKLLPVESKVSTSETLAFIGGLWFLYVAFYTWHPTDGMAVYLELVPGIFGILFLSYAGFTRDDLFFRIRRISSKGLIVLALFTLLEPIILLSGEFKGLNLAGLLLFAPASAIAQELFFRSSLLPALQRALPQNPQRALFFQAALFAIWHLPTVALTAPIGGIVAVLLVTFTGGLVWAWQVKRDQTILWAIIHHTLLLMVHSFFKWG